MNATSRDNQNATSESCDATDRTGDYLPDIPASIQVPYNTVIAIGTVGASFWNVQIHSILPLMTS